MRFNYFIAIFYKNFISITILPLSNIVSRYVNITKFSKIKMHHKLLLFYWLNSHVSFLARFLQVSFIIIIWVKFSDITIIYWVKFCNSIIIMNKIFIILLWQFSFCSSLLMSIIMVHKIYIAGEINLQIDKSSAIEGIPLFSQDIFF